MALRRQVEEKKLSLCGTSYWDKCRVGRETELETLITKGDLTVKQSLRLRFIADVKYQMALCWKIQFKFHAYKQVYVSFPTSTQSVNCDILKNAQKPQKISVQNMDER